MTGVASTIFSVLGALGTVVTVAGGLVVWFRLRPELAKLRAEARKTDVDAAVAESAAEDDHWAEIVKTQTEALVGPLRQEVERQAGQISQLEGKVGELRDEVDALRTRYWRAIGYVRLLREHWGRPVMPPPMDDIAADL